MVSFIALKCISVCFCVLWKLYFQFKHKPDGKYHISPSLISFSHLHHSLQHKEIRMRFVFSSSLSVDLHLLWARCWHLFSSALAPVRKSNPIRFYIPQIVTVTTQEEWANWRGQRDANKQACRWITQRLCQQHARHCQRRHRPRQPWQFDTQGKRRKGQQNDTEQTNGEKTSYICDLPPPWHLCFFLLLTPCSLCVLHMFIWAHMYEVQSSLLIHVVWNVRHVSSH